jgi:hypothetical protein
VVGIGGWQHHHLAAAPPLRPQLMVIAVTDALLLN